MMDHDRTTPLHWKLTQMTASLIHEQGRDILPSSIVQRKTLPSSPTKQGEAHQQFQCAEALTHLPLSVITNINVSIHPSNQSLLPLTPDTDETYPTSPRLVETHLASSHLKMDITHPSNTPTQHNISSLQLRCSFPSQKPTSPSLPSKSGKYIEWSISCMHPLKKTLLIIPPIQNSTRLDTNLAFAIASFSLAYEHVSSSAPKILVYAHIYIRIRIRIRNLTDE